MALAVIALALVVPARSASGQGVTTSSVTGVVKDAQGLAIPGATVTAVHEPSGTTYEAVTNEQGRFNIPGMRIGGPYTVTATLAGFQPKVVRDVALSLGVGSDVEMVLGTVAVEETVTVTGQSDPVFSSNRTGAATAVQRVELDTLPTVGGRLNDITRLTPQYTGGAFGGSFAGQDNRLNNITVDGSYFNNSFGLSGQPGDRTGVAPISLEAIEQVQVSVAPFDVRQGNFVGAGVNTVTRSGTNQLRGSFYHRFRNEDYVGTDAKGLTYNPGTFTYRNTGGWASAPIIKNKLFVFGNYEDEEDVRPLSTFQANPGGVPAGGSVSRVLASDLNALSSRVSSQFGYDTGPYENIDDLTPAKRFMTRGDYNLSGNHKVSFRYNLLDSITDVPMSTSSSLGLGRGGGAGSTTYMSFQNSNYQIMENIKSGIGEWNWILGSNMANQMIAGYTTQDESRASRGAFFPLVDIQDGSGTAYTSLGFEPFTPNNELRYKTFQLQDNFTKFGAKHSLTFGFSVERYESENVFFPGSQSVYVYSSLADYYTDINDLAANPNRTTSPVTLRRFQVRYMNIPGLEKPVQPLEVWYSGAYAQDEWRPRSNVTVTAGVRFDVPKFGDTGFQNADADALTFRDENGQAVQYQTAKLPDANVLWSPRVGINWDVNSNQSLQVRGGTGVFTGRPAYVWISNQIGNTGVLTGFDQFDNTRNRPFNPDPAAYKPTNVTGAPAASYELALTDPGFKFPQIWRSNIAVDKRLPWGMVATGEYIYNRDVNGIYYINANLPAAQSSFAGADTRPRYTSNRIYSNVANATVMKNQDVGRSWNVAASLSMPQRHGLSMKTAYSYGRSKNTIDAGSIAYGSWSGNPQSGDPNNPGLGFSSQGHRVFVAGTYSKQYFNFGATTVSVFWEGRNGGNFSYLFAADMNGDGAVNDLIYIPRDVSEMNFSTFTSGGRTYTAAEQAAAYDAYIQQDSYLREHRGEYAERGAGLLPMVFRADLNLTQDIFANLGGKKHGFQVRLDIQNFTNMLNSDWGVGQRVVRDRILTNPAVDAQGRSTYRMVVVNNQLLSKSFESTASSNDVWSFLISLRYSFN